MKKIIYINILIALTCTSCLKKFTVREGITTKMPSKVQTLSNEQKQDKPEAFKIADGAYTYDGMLVGLSENADADMKKMSLEEHKNDFVLRYGSFTKIASADIKTYNGKSYCVINLSYKSKGADVTHYIFTNDSQHADHLVVGFIQYDPATQQTKAEKLLGTILSNLDTK